MGPPCRHAELDAPVLGMVHERSSVERHMTRHFRRPLTLGITPAEYCFGATAPAHLYMPEDIPTGEWPRFRMSRRVFRELFVEKSSRLDELDQRTISVLQTQRSEQTVGVRSDSVPYS